MLQPSEKIWMDGKFVNWADASVHVLTHSLHYGLAAFEGIRCYKGRKGSAIFRLPEHVDRLFGSAHIAMMQIPYEKKQVADAIVETVRVNRLEACYIRPLVYIGYGAMGLYPGENPIRMAIAAWQWGTYLGDEALTNGIRAKVSSFTRHHVNVAMTRAKISGYYLTSILEGITRNSVIQLARERGIPVVEERFTRDAMYVADEVFLTGTAAEIAPVREIDGRRIGTGKPGPLTMDLQKTFFEIVRGEDSSHESWLTRV